MLRLVNAMNDPAHEEMLDALQQLADFLAEDAKTRGPCIIGTAPRGPVAMDYYTMIAAYNRLRNASVVPGETQKAPAEAGAK